MDINRLKWASRRGMRELDLVLLPFLEGRYPELDPQDQQLFVQLLENEDNDMFDWFMGKSRPNEEDTCRIVDLIREYSQRGVS